MPARMGVHPRRGSRLGQNQLGQYNTPSHLHPTPFNHTIVAATREPHSPLAQPHKEHMLAGIKTITDSSKFPSWANRGVG